MENMRYLPETWEVSSCHSQEARVDRRVIGRNEWCVYRLAPPPRPLHPHDQLRWCGGRIWRQRVKLRRRHWEAAIATARFFAGSWDYWTQPQYESCPIDSTTKEPKKERLIRSPKSKHTKRTMRLIRSKPDKQVIYKQEGRPGMEVQKLDEIATVGPRMQLAAFDKKILLQH